MPLDKKIKSQKYETDLINLIKDYYVILITASPYRRSYKILRDIKEKTGFEPDESFWNFGRQPPALKKYWMENEVMPQHGEDGDKYLAIESNPATRRMFKKLGIEARPNGDIFQNFGGKTMDKEHVALQIKKTCKKCGKTLDISNFSNFKKDKYSPEDYCKDCEKLIVAAKDLDQLIDIYGFGTEFSTEDLYKYFENELIANSRVKLLIEHDLLIKNKLTENYHFSDIVTCNNFIKENNTEPINNGDYDFKEILTPLDEKYANNFNPKQMNLSGIAWINFNGVSWIYQRSV